MKKVYILLLVFLCFVNNSQSQSEPLSVLQLNTITTAVPFLIIGPDARAGGMGDLGVATDPDASSMHWNPAKYAFNEDEFGICVSYTPWLRALIPDINLSYLSGYFKRNDDEAIGFSIRHFSLGDITFTNNNGDVVGQFNPSEFAVSSAYSRKLSDQFSTSIALRYIHSNLTGGQSAGEQSTKAGQSVAADFSLYYKMKSFTFLSKKSYFAFGSNISNIGSKISYTETAVKDFIPINLRLGSSFKTEIDNYNQLVFSFDVNKLLVPTPPQYHDSIVGEIVAGMDPNVSVVSGIFQSFYDAPQGFKEELAEFNYSIGAEFLYTDQFAFRLGYFHEAPSKGDRTYFTLGAGLRYNVFGLDFSYLIPVRRRDEAGAINPLANTLRFSLTFDFGAFEAKN
tara:strand:- start:433 stop:1620 length:1188 start_codon:yes stop_codon:yes gene_type:complete